MAKAKDPLLSTPNSDSEKNGIAASSTETERSNAPDGGWGWVVCAASFLVNFIVDGTMFSFGVLLLHLLDSFHASKAKLAWVGSGLAGMSMLMGPFVSILLEKYSCRQITIAGGMLSGTAFIVSIFSPNVEVLIITYGVIAGTGFCMAFITSIIVVGLYFHERRAIATGIAMSGSGLGTFAYAYFCEQLLQEFNWQGTVLIMAGLIFNCVVCGALYRPISKRTIAETQSGSQCKLDDFSNKASGFSMDDEEINNKVQLRKEFVSSLYFSDRFNRNLVHSMDHIPSDLKLELNAKLYYSATDIKQNCLQPQFASLTNLKLRPKRPKSILAKDIFYSGSLRNIQCNKQSLSFLSTSVGCNCRHECTKPDDAESDTGTKEKCCKVKGRLLLSLVLFKDKTFLLLLLTFTTWTVQTVTLTFLPGMAVSKGIPSNQAALLISLIGIFNTAGRILAGFVTDCLHFRSINIYTCALLIAASVNLMFPWCESFGLMAACSSVFGLCMACAVSLRTIVLADHLGIDKLTQSFGVVAMIQGVAFMINPPIAGMLFDVFDSYKSPFIMAGSMYIISGLSCLVIRFMKIPNNSDEININEPEHDDLKSVADSLLQKKGMNEGVITETGSHCHHSDCIAGDCCMATDSIGTDDSAHTEETLQND